MHQRPPTQWGVFSRLEAEESPGARNRFLRRRIVPNSSKRPVVRQGLKLIVLVTLLFVMDWPGRLERSRRS